METLLLYFYLTLFIFLFYKTATVLYYRYYLRTKLQNASLKKKKKILGSGYQFKTIYNGATRYKWVKGWIKIRATFDDNGNLLEEDRPQYDYSKTVSEFYFTKCG